MLDASTELGSDNEEVAGLKNIADVVLDVVVSTGGASGSKREWVVLILNAIYYIPISFLNLVIQ